MTLKEIAKLKTKKARVLALLSDGAWHTWQELHWCVLDELASRVAFQQALTDIRKELPEGEGILSKGRGPSLCYRLVRFVPSQSRD